MPFFRFNNFRPFGNRRSQVTMGLSWNAQSENYFVISVHHWLKIHWLKSYLKFVCNPIPVDQFRYIKIQPKTIDLSTRLCGINPTAWSYSPESRVEVYYFRLNFNIYIEIGLFVCNLTITDCDPSLTDSNKFCGARNFCQDKNTTRKTNSDETRSPSHKQKVR